MAFYQRLIGACCLFLLTLNPALALDMQVDTTVDAVDADLTDGQCLTSAGSCSLRAAVMQANASGEPENRIFLFANTYSLKNTGSGEDLSETGDLDITSSISIVGLGADQSIIDGYLRDRVLDVHNNGYLTLDGVTVQKGRFGTWIVGSGSQEDPSIVGAGIRNEGQLTVKNSVISDNYTPGDGAAIHTFFGNVQVINSEISNNESMSFGAGIYIQDGTLTIKNSTFKANYFRGFPVTISGGAIAIFNAKIRISGSTFVGNRAFRDGGAIYFALGDVVITNSTFTDNLAERFGGAIHVNGGSNDAGVNWFKSIKLINTTIANNRAMGKGENNVVVTPDTAGGGVYLNRLGTVFSVNSIFAENIPTDCHVGSGGAMVSLGYNLDTDGSCGLAGEGDLSNVADAGLAPLADNGGPTPTLALQAGVSPAIDAGSDENCASIALIDQRGYGRPAMGCDIGAFELGGDSGAEPVIPINVPADNLAPMAFDMTVFARVGSPVTGIFNGADPDGDELTFEVLEQLGFNSPFQGVGDGVLDEYRLGDRIPGLFVYTPDTEQVVESDMFTYRACDKWLVCSGPARVRVFIAPAEQGAQGEVLMQIVSTSAGNAVNEQVISENVLGAIVPEIDYDYPLGAFYFKLENTPTGVGTPGQVVVTIKLPATAQIAATAVVRKMDKWGAWRTLDTAPSTTVSTAVIDAAAKTITLRLIDNDIYDLNPLAGQIEDPVALAVPVPEPQPSPEPGPSPVVAKDEGGSGALNLGWLVLLLLFARRRYP